MMFSKRTSRKEIALRSKERECWGPGLSVPVE